jgi:hypothetical protein
VGLCFERKPYRLKHALEFSIDFEVGEPNNTIAEIVQGPVPDRITFTILIEAVLIAIDLDHKARPSALKVHDIACNGD